jgi:single-strand DNA-binding protein
MASVNRVILVGNLGRDPELRYTAGGQPVASFSIATNERWNDREGKTQERTEWHRIVVWGKQGENCANYLQKGRTVYIEGRLQTREWEDKEGQKRQTTEVVAQTVQFLDRREGAPRASGGSGEPGASSEPGSDPGPASSGGSDDIPF